MNIQPTSSAGTTRSWKDWVGLAARLTLGIALAYAGLLKVGNLDANVAQVELYQFPFPGWLETAIGYSQPFLEIIVGVLLILGLATRVSAILGGLAMIFFIIGISWAWSKGLQIDCGCFSLGGELDPGEKTKYARDIARDIVFLAAGVWLTIRPRSIFALDNWLAATPSYQDLNTTDDKDDLR